MIHRSGRRRFLAGLGGLFVALPFLEGLADRKAHADPIDERFFLFFRQWYGVQQRPRWGGPGAEPEGFWPDVDIAPGQSIALTKDLLAKTSATGDLRATGELADFADSLLLLRGVRLMDLSVILHRQNLVQVMTGSNFQPTRPGKSLDDPNNAWPLHETLDTLIARKLDGSTPLVFESVISGTETSFTNGKDGGIPTENPTLQQPSAAYAQLFTKAQLDAHAQAIRVYASDAVASELKTLRNDPRLSADDRHRLDQHFDALNSVEAKLRCIPPTLDDPQWQPVVDSDLVKTSSLGLPPDQQLRRWQTDGSNFNEYTETVADAFIQIAALGAACGAFRAANLVMPAPTNFDHSSIFDPGTPGYNQGFPGHYHSISHRSFNDTMDNDPSLGDAAVNAHHRIDRWHGRQFAKLLGLLRDHGILDKGVTLWSNEISFGSHFAYDMPYIIAGSAGGKLKTGQYLDLQTQPVEESDTQGDTASLMSVVMNKQTPCSKVLNTIGAALGLTGDDGSPLADFGGYQRDPQQNPLPRVLGNLPALLT
jgi:hypothetical protein